MNRDSWNHPLVHLSGQCVGVVRVKEHLIEYSGLVLLTSILATKSAQVWCNLIPVLCFCGKAESENDRRKHMWFAAALPPASAFRCALDVIHRSGGGRHVGGWCVYRAWVNQDQDYVYPANPDQYSLPALLYCVTIRGSKWRLDDEQSKSNGNCDCAGYYFQYRASTLLVSLRYRSPKYIRFSQER